MLLQLPAPLPSQLLAPLQPPAAADAARTATAAFAALPAHPAIAAGSVTVALKLKWRQSSLVVAAEADVAALVVAAPTQPALGPPDFPAWPPPEGREHLVHLLLVRGLKKRTCTDCAYVCNKYNLTNVKHNHFYEYDSIDYFN